MTCLLELVQIRVALVLPKLGDAFWQAEWLGWLPVLDEARFVGGYDTVVAVGVLKRLRVSK